MGTEETRTAELTFRDDRILRVAMKPDAAVHLADAQENHEATCRLVGSGRFTVLVDARPARSVDRAARVFFADASVRKDTVAQAIVIDSGLSRVLGNFFIGLNRPRFPTKLFTDPEAAVRWLLGFEL